MTTKTQYIWIHHNGPDVYAEFIDEFLANDGGRYALKVACDGMYAVYINDELAMFGQSSDYAFEKLYDKKDVTKYCKKDGKNTLRILVWNMGIDTQNYKIAPPAVWFELTQNKRKIVYSGEHTLSRQDVRFENGLCKLLTIQLGYSYHFDNTIKNTLPFEKSVVVNDYAPPKYRNMAPMYLMRYKSGNIKPLDEHTILVDLKRETVGFLRLQLHSEEKQKIEILWAEHLVDGHVQRKIAIRDFSLHMTVEGETDILHPLRRMAGRYVEVRFEKPITLYSLGVQEIMRPMRKKKVDVADKQLKKIYDVSVRTLQLCMHEHYEDCPWREQCMYLMDTRNQMLCGYYAFDGYKFQRENLLFFANGQREDGFFSICFPTGIDIPIPSFSLAYPMIVDDYLTQTGDTSVLKKVQPVMKKLLDAFANAMDENGLIPNFPYPYWNFYEWAPDSDNKWEITRTPQDPFQKEYHLILNCMYVYGCNLYQKIFGADMDTAKTKKAIQDTFFVKEKGLFKLNTNGESFSQLGNSMALLIGLGDKAMADKILTDKTLIPVTLSMHTFLYDALLQFGDTYKPFILQNIREKYQYMLDNDATTFWETLKGWQDFDDAGSLCHGWSAIPVYYLNKLGYVKQK